MSPLTDTDREEWHDVHPRADLPEVHARTIAGRIVAAFGVAIVLALAIAGAEIASDWLHSGRPM